MSEFIYQLGFLCGHKTNIINPTEKLPTLMDKDGRLFILTIVGSYRYCEICNDLQRIIRVTILDSEYHNKLIEQKVLGDKEKNYNGK